MGCHLTDTYILHLLFIYIDYIIQLLKHIPLYKLYSVLKMLKQQTFTGNDDGKAFRYQIYKQMHLKICTIKTFILPAEFFHHC